MFLVGWCGANRPAASKLRLGRSKQATAIYRSGRPSPRVLSTLVAVVVTADRWRVPRSALTCTKHINSLRVPLRHISAEFSTEIAYCGSVNSKV